MKAKQPKSKFTFRLDKEKLATMHKIAYENNYPSLNEYLTSICDKIISDRFHLENTTEVITTLKENQLVMNNIISLMLDDEEDEKDERD